MPRTKEPDRERYPNGRAKPIEGPTAETLKKFQDKAATYHIPAHKEAGYAESTIGVLEARGLISIEQAELCKKLANLRSVLYGSGNAKCSSIENVGRGLPNDSESKAMRETWTAYKAATDGMEPADRRLFEHVVLRNNYREWMKLGDGDLVKLYNHVNVDHSKPVSEDEISNYVRSSSGSYYVVAKRREVRLLLRVIHTLSQRMPQELRAGQSATGYTAMSEAQRNALDGDEKLAKLYADKAKREKK